MSSHDCGQRRADHQDGHVAVGQPPGTERGALHPTGIDEDVDTGVMQVRAKLGQMTSQASGIAAARA